MYNSCSTSPISVDIIDNLISDCVPLSPSDSIETLKSCFLDQTQYSALPVVADDTLVGSAHHTALFTLQATQNNNSESLTVNDLTLRRANSVQSGLSLLEVCRMVREGLLTLEDSYLAVTHANGKYKGVVTIPDLLFHFAQLRLNYARYDNPLSRLPGSVPVDETIDALLEASKLFVVVHCDINDFKGFNDAYGYSRGDDVILFIASLLQQIIDPELDFVGHTGNDDFVIVFQSPDWFDRCEEMERGCALKAADFYTENHRRDKGINTYNRMGRQVFTPFFSLSLGAVQVEPGKFLSHHEVRAAAVEVKQRAKSTFGGAIYIDERTYSCPETQRPLMRN